MTEEQRQLKQMWEQMVKQELDNSITNRLSPEMTATVKASIVKALTCMNYSVEEMDLCPFDETTIKDIEQYIDQCIRRRVLKIDKNDMTRFLRVQTANGVATSSANHLHAVEQMVHYASVLFAYCMANVIGAALVEHPDSGFQVVPSDPEMLTSYPCIKVFKYLKNGAEDSLLGMVRTTKKSPQTNAQFMFMVEQLKEFYMNMSGANDFPPGYVVQRWCDSEGNLDKVSVVDASGKLLAEAYKE